MQHLLCLGLNHRTAPLALRERLAYTPAARDAALGRFSRRRSRHGRHAEGVLLSTCNRVELYALLETGTADPIAPLVDLLVETRGVPAATLAPHLY